MLIKRVEGHPAVVVEDLTPGGPAASCGQIRVGDRLLAVDGRPVAGMTLSVVHGLINGPAGGVLRLQMAQPREGGGMGGRGAGGGGSGNSTPRDGEIFGSLSSACYSIAGKGSGGGSGTNTPRRQSQEQERGGSSAYGAVYEVELVRAALEANIE
jgi:hypothetical protein